MTKSRQKEQSAEMSFLEHLEELRRTLVRMAVATLLAMLICFGFTYSSPSPLFLVQRLLCPKAAEKF